MSIISQNKLPLSSQHHFHPCSSPAFHSRIHCSITTTTKPNRLVIESSTVHPTPFQATRRAPPQLNDPSLKSTWLHRVWLVSGCTTVLISLAKSLVRVASLHIWAEPTLAGLVGYVLADLGSGVYHWGIDNYGSASTPIFGTQIEAFQGHHKLPWTITKRQFANNLHALARTVTFVVLPIDLLCDDPTFLCFVGMCSGCIMFSQQFHAWAHGTKSRLPPLVVMLQDLGILVSRSQHGAHHRAPYNNNYCIVSGVWNEVLDNQKVFEALEMLLFFKLGVRPRSWIEPNSDWSEEIGDPSQLTTN
ncbi:fatty acid desaturase 4, chloroplastic-like [Humulus lupulus]|uniref:fatty acid desaturase 4, chloroplastic-like n=1 Tax=Humulus lupulus TaxID=3486 RepID=UPI002B40617F|nr:fatty acid desaturase 4, chloroplastic-like [Humulus lupulus]